MRSSQCLTANAEVATVLGSISASSDTVESEGRRMKQCWIQYIEKNPNNPPVEILQSALRSHPKRDYGSDKKTSEEGGSIERHRECR
jgi:hypothetical protein